MTTPPPPGKYFNGLYKCEEQGEGKTEEGEV
jgi:hypothetical protein